jgi:hypothetical protein
MLKKRQKIQWLKEKKTENTLAKRKKDRKYNG